MSYRGHPSAQKGSADSAQRVTAVLGTGRGAVACVFAFLGRTKGAWDIPARVYVSARNRYGSLVARPRVMGQRQGSLGTVEGAAVTILSGPQS